MPCFLYEGLRDKDKLQANLVKQIRLKTRLPSQGLEVDYRRAKRDRRAEYNRRLAEIAKDLEGRDECQVIAGLEFLKGRAVRVDRPAMPSKDGAAPEGGDDELLADKPEVDRYLKLLGMAKAKALRLLKDEDPRCADAVSAASAEVLRPMDGEDPPDEAGDDEPDVMAELAAREDRAASDGLPAAEADEADAGAVAADAGAWDVAEGSSVADKPRRGKRRSRNQG
jgi:hypothetical protein